MTNHIQKNTLSDLDSPIFAIEDELVAGTVQHKCEKGNEVFADLKIRNGELYKNDSITQDNELKRILVKYSVKKD